MVFIEFVFITSENKIQPYPFINPIQTKGRFFMKSQSYSHQDLVRIAKFTPDDFARIRECRQDHTRLGFAYQLAFVRLYHRFPSQQPLEIDDEIVTYASVQLDIPSSRMIPYQEQRRTIINHQKELRSYLGVRRFGEAELEALEAYLFDEASRLEQTSPLLNQAKRFLDDQSILFPSGEVLICINGADPGARRIWMIVVCEVVGPVHEGQTAITRAVGRRHTSASSTRGCQIVEGDRPPVQTRAGTEYASEILTQ